MDDFDQSIEILCSTLDEVKDVFAVLKEHGVAWASETDLFDSPDSAWLMSGYLPKKYIHLYGDGVRRITHGSSKLAREFVFSGTADEFLSTYSSGSQVSVDVSEFL